MQFADCIINPASRELTRDGVAVAVEPKTFDLLLYLIAHRERAVGKDELQDNVWGTIVTDAALTRAIMKIRKAVGDETQNSRIIKTIPRFGYRFVADIEDAPTSAAAQKNSATRRGIAVLPLANMSGDPENSYFSDGIAEEILNLLARIPELRVASRTSSFAFRDSQKSLSEIADALNAEIILEGSVRKSGNRVRITMQLISADDDSHLWSEIYDRELTDIFAVQAEIAKQVVGALSRGEAGNIPIYQATNSARAYEYYLRGRQLYHAWDRGRMLQAKDMFEQAIALDPNYAKAWAGLADCASMAYMWWDQSDELLNLADSASQKALQLDPALAESHTARAFALTLLQSFDAATEEFEHATALDPLLYEAWYLFGRSRFAEGRPADAARLFEKAAEVRPDEFQASCLATTAFTAADDQENRLRSAKNAVPRVERHLSLNPEDTRAWTLGGCVLEDLEQHDRANTWIEKAISIAPDDVGVLHNAGCFYAAKGEVERALDLFEKRLAQGNIYQEWIDNDSDFDSIRDNPRFLKMLEKARSG
ncbi:MAG: TPR end-of-group domain-containing protein [Woeseiaceae bacterium]